MPIDTQSDPHIKTPEPRQLSRSIVLILMWLILLNLFFSQIAENQPVPYSDFINQVEAGKVARVVISPNRIQYILKSDRTANQSDTSSSKTHITIPVALDSELPKILREHDVQFLAPSPAGTGWIATLLSWIIPPLVSTVLKGVAQLPSPSGKARLAFMQKAVQVSHLMMWLG